MHGRLCRWLVGSNERQRRRLLAALSVPVAAEQASVGGGTGEESEGDRKATSGRPAVDDTLGRRAGLAWQGRSRLDIGLEADICGSTPGPALPNRTKAGSKLKMGGGVDE